MAILALAISVTMVSAASVPQVLLSPSQSMANTQQDISLSVTNTGGSSNIVGVVLMPPQDANGNLIYPILDSGTPTGWEKTAFDKKIVWTATGSGIALNDKTNFVVTTMSPASGQYQWAWTITYANNEIYTGTSTTGISMAPLAYFRIDGAPSTLLAGNAFKITVRAYGNDDTIKTDYVGTIKFTSSDAKALLPSDYTFTASDRGSKDFFVTYKTQGGQTVTITDWTAKITQKSAVTNVEAGAPTSIAVKPANAEVNPSNSVTYTAMAKDKYGNEFDITKMTKWSIDAQAGGNWNANVYMAQNIGIWTVTGTYNSLVDGETLTVKQGATATPTPQPTATPENETQETPAPVVTPTPIETPIVNQTVQEMNIETQDSQTVVPGTNNTFIVTVNNVGSKNLTDVTLTTQNVSSEWVSVYPSNVSIDAGTSKDFLVVVTVPENTTEVKNVNIVASSNEGVTAQKAVTLNIGTTPTGLMGLSKNLLNLGIVIVAVAALVLIAWELWFRKSK
jgi:hypothetical protein